MKNSSPQNINDN